MNAPMESAPKREDYADLRAFVAAHEAYWDGVSPGRSAILSRAARLANDAAVAIDMQLWRIHDELGGGDPDALWKALVDVDFLVCAMEDAARWRLDAASHGAVVDRASRV